MAVSGGDVPSVLADRRRRAVGMIGAGHVWPIASGWVDGIAAGLAKNSPPMHDVIDRRVRAFVQGLARGLTDVPDGRLYRAVQNGEFSYRYAAPPRIED